MSNPSWRSNFIELCEAIFRDLGFDPPAMLHDDNLPLAMELEIDQRDFELLHSSSDRPERVLIICRLGSLPELAGRAHLAALLSANLPSARNYQPCFGINADRGEVISLCYEDLSEIRAPMMLEKLRALAAGSVQWQQRLFDPLTSNDDLGTEAQGVTLA